MQQNLHMTKRVFKSSMTKKNRMEQQKTQQIYAKNYQMKQKNNDLRDYSKTKNQLRKAD